MKKLIVRLAIALVLVLIIGLVVVFFSLNSIVKKGVETVGPVLTKVDVRLGSAQISPFSGSGQLTKLVVGNPEGYKTPSAIQVGNVKMDLEIGSVLSDTIVIEEINIQVPEITFEGGLSGNNLSKILDNLESADSGKTPEATSSEKKFYVQKLVVDGGKIHLSTPMLAGKALTVTLPPLHLENIGSRENGVTAAELSKQIMRPLVASAVKSATEALANVGKELKAVGVDAGEQAQKVTRSLKGIFKGPDASTNR